MTETNQMQYIVNTFPNTPSGPRAFVHPTGKVMSWVRNEFSSISDKTVNIANAIKALEDKPGGGDNGQMTNQLNLLKNQLNSVTKELSLLKNTDNTVMKGLGVLNNRLVVLEKGRSERAVQLDDEMNYQYRSSSAEGINKRFENKAALKNINEEGDCSSIEAPLTDFSLL